ncbi:MAG: hypothetical protein EOP88_11105 [Verrucomicrobiaceae bacterium]|nr:MAG: hypothetical protein EOP88_11105 [Verrucomicrobiaceae bacterium]
MKPTLLLPPVVALIVVVVWLGNGRQKIAALEKETATLKQRLATRSNGFATDDPSGKGKPAGKQAKGKEPVDWKQVAAQMLEMNQGGGMGDMRSMIRLQKRLQDMEKEDLVAALEEIATMDLPDQSRQMLEQMLIGQLCQKDPELALTRHLDRLGDEGGGMSWQLANAMKEWTRKDPAKATAWFDKQIAAGKFDSRSLDGKSQPRMQFEGVLVANLLSHDEAAAAARLEALPENQRGELLRRYASNDVKAEDQLNYANLVRGVVSESEQATTLAQIAAREAHQDGYTAATEYLDRIKVTPSERAISVAQVANEKILNLSHKRKITREDIDGLREWASTQSPETSNEVTGSAIARSTEVNQRLEFSEAAELALHYQKESGSDEVLVRFLKDRPSFKDKAEVLKLAESISDGKIREEIIKSYQ